MTDYDFPPMWGKMSQEQKHNWFCRRRAYKQAIQQDTAFGRRYREMKQRVKDRKDRYRYK